MSVFPSSNQRRTDINDKSREYLYQSIQIGSETEKIGDATIDLLHAQGETLNAAAEEVSFGLETKLIH